MGIPNFESGRCGRTSKGRGERTASEVGGKPRKRQSLSSQENSGYSFLVEDLSIWSWVHSWFSIMFH